MPTPDINRILKRESMSGARGAPMGQSSFHDACSPLYLQQVRLGDGGDYAADGTYWGGGIGMTPLWCAFNGDDDGYAAGQGSRIYVRARNREVAKQRVLARFANATFRR